MEHKMRRFKQQLTDDECIKILCSSTSGVLSLCGNDRRPYGVPLSHVYKNGKIYFHSALSGYKLELLRQNANVCFTVIAKDEIHPEKYTTYFQSVIVFGKVRIINDYSEKMSILEILGHRCNSDDPEGLKEELRNGIARCVALEMCIERLTGKQAIELVN